MGSQFAPLFTLKDPQVGHELQRIYGLLKTVQDSIADIHDSLKALDVDHLDLPTALNSEPAVRWAGMIVRADRTTWDPLGKGSGGSYLVWYNGAAWRAPDQQ